jgi:hypothetical protein
MRSRESVLQAALIRMRADFLSLVRTSGVGRQVRVPVCVNRALAKYDVGCQVGFQLTKMKGLANMKKETIETFVRQLDGMITALQQAVVIGGRTQKEGEACELLKDARLKLVEDLETRSGEEQHIEDKNHFSSWGLHDDK